MVLAAQSLTHEVAMSVNETKQAILHRVAAAPVFAIVPEHAIALFDKVMSETESEAYVKYPSDYWSRVDFWKRVILNRVSPTLRGLVAVQYHEYIAALRRGDGDGISGGFDSVPPYGGEARAQRDAYMACCAGIA
jgi:hypothetical protein